MYSNSVSNVLDISPGILCDSNVQGVDTTKIWFGRIICCGVLLYDTLMDSRLCVTVGVCVCVCYADFVAGMCASLA